MRFQCLLRRLPPPVFVPSDRSASSCLVVGSKARTRTSHAHAPRPSSYLILLAPFALHYSACWFKCTPVSHCLTNGFIPSDRSASSCLLMLF